MTTKAQETRTGHTPGPWLLEKRRQSAEDKRSGYSAYEILHPLINEDGEYKGSIGGYCVVIGRANCLPGYMLSEADARLIAAAPDLLAACRDVLTAYQHQMSFVMWGKVYSAVSRATE